MKNPEEITNHNKPTITMSEKLRVGITHGDINGVGYEVILKAFEDSTMLDLCIPIVYGSPKVAAYHRKAIDSPTAFTIIPDLNYFAPIPA